MPNSDFGRVLLPWCIQRLSQGNHVVLNRNYKPIGFGMSEYIHYGA